MEYEFEKDHRTRNYALYSLPKACELFNLIQNL